MLNACFVVASLLLAIIVLGELYLKKWLFKISFLRLSDRPNLFKNIFQQIKTKTKLCKNV